MSQGKLERESAKRTQNIRFRCMEGGGRRRLNATLATASQLSGEKRERKCVYSRERKRERE